MGWLSPAPFPRGPAAYSQILSASLQNDTQYTLTGFVGHPIGFGGSQSPATVYTVTLLAGNNTLATSFGTGPEGSLAPFSLSYRSLNSPFLGQALQIRLASSQAQTAFDDIRLNAVIPEPSSVLMMAMGGLGVFGYGWQMARRRRGRRL